jgi:hypothetical protein
MRAKAEGGLKHIYYGLGGLAALIVAIFAVILAVVFWPEKPSSVERRGAFEAYWYHYDSLGEPGHERMELWYHGRRLAEYPTYTSLNPELDRIIYVDAKDTGFQKPNPESNGVYYFDARNGKKYKLRTNGYPSFLNGAREFPGNGAQIPKATPWSPDGTFAVISCALYDPSPPRWDHKETLIVDLATGSARNVADLLDVNESENVIFRGWSQNLTMIFAVGDETRELPLAAVLVK